jgi:hypothetical protein
MRIRYRYLSFILCGYGSESDFFDADSDTDTCFKRPNRSDLSLRQMQIRIEVLKWCRSGSATLFNCQRTCQRKNYKLADPDQDQHFFLIFLFFTVIKWKKYKIIHLKLQDSGPVHHWRHWHSWLLGRYFQEWTVCWINVVWRIPLTKLIISRKIECPNASPSVTFQTTLLRHYTICSSQCRHPITKSLLVFSHTIIKQGPPVPLSRRTNEKSRMQLQVTNNAQYEKYKIDLEQLKYI